MAEKKPAKKTAAKKGAAKKTAAKKTAVPKAAALNVGVEAKRINCPDPMDSRVR